MSKKRITAIDVMRGLSLLGMMLVNLVPDEELSYPAFVHTPWSGISLADCFFPCFLFLAGVSAAVNAERKLYGKGWFTRALKRGICLILIGMIYNHLPCVWALIFNSGYGLDAFFTDVTRFFRPLGVLQRIGFAYIFGVVIYHFLKTRRANLIAACAILAVTTVGFYLYSPSAPFSEADNISIFTDQMLQGTDHNYLQKIFDPEGMYGNVTAVGSILLGMVAGSLLAGQEHRTLAGLGCVLSLAGGVTGVFVLVSKPLWTASYVLILSGVFMIILTTLDDLLNRFRSAGKILKLAEILGMHSMLTYLVSGTLEALLNAVNAGKTNLYHYLWGHTVYIAENPALSCLIASLIVIALVCCIVCVADRLILSGRHRTKK